MISAETSTTKNEYTYDDRGNILTKKEYTVTVDENGEKVYTLVDGNADAYVYDDIWKDKLISYNGQSITYDAVGNPINYMGNTLTWTMGRQLASFGDISYTYNEAGIRTSKASNGVTTKFYLDDTNIIEQTDGTTTLHFFYDSNGEVVGFKYNGNNYIYVKNSMGDIVGVADIDGNLIASYTYDAWGKVTAITGSNIAIGEINPFRYRCYYYDSDTQLYYLNSRYYDAGTGRFINSDDANCIGATTSGLSYNAFAYCENNPTNRWDTTGYSSNSIEILVKALLIYFAAYGFLSKLLKGKSFEFYGNVKKDANGLFSMKVRYKPNKNKKTRKSFTLILGDSDAWNNCTNLYNDSSQAYLDYYSQYVYDLTSKLGTSEDVDLLHLQLMNAILAGTIAYFGIKANNAKKVYNAVWGSKGLDPSFSLNYYALKIKNDSTYNGTYAYSLSLDSWKELNV